MVCGIVLLIIKVSIANSSSLAIEMLFLFMFCTICTYGLTKVIENSQKAIKQQKAAMIKFVYSSEEALTNAARDRIKFNRFILPVLLLFLTIAFLIIFVLELNSKIKAGALYLGYAFVVGVLLLIFSAIIVSLGIVKKERLFANDKIRKYAYVYLSILVSLMLIAK